MRPLVTPDEMQRADTATIEAGTPVEVLMERAGRAVARAAIEMLGGRYGRKVVVVCGKGNNGGDGYAAARVLRGEGVGVKCLTVAEPSDLKGAALIHHDRAKHAGVRIEPFDAEGLSKADLIIDAIFGTGFLGPRDDGPLPSPPTRAIDAIQRLKATWDSGVDTEAAPRVLAVDIPSGLHGEHGLVGYPHVDADRTVTFGAEKLGTFVADPSYVGDVEVVDIGLRKAEGHIQVMESADVAALIPERRSDAHKKTTGSVAVIAGSDAMTGAAALVVRGAARAGAGYIQVLTTPRAADVVHELCPEALVTTVRDRDQLGPDALDAFADALSNARAVAIGPGLGQGEGQRGLVKRVLKEFEGPIVVDADALNVISGEADVLAREEIVITPHPGELGRLLGTDARKVQDRRVESVVEAVRRFGCVVVLKGFRTVIGYPSDAVVGFVSQEEWDRIQADPKLRGTPVPFSFVDLRLNPTGGPRLASAGTGDVLTGAVAAWLPLTSHGSRPEAVAAMVYLHGLAGDLLADGAVAWDVAEALPDAIALVSDA